MNNKNNTVIDYPGKRAGIIEELDLVPKIFAELEEFLKECGFQTVAPDEVKGAMFSPDPLKDLRVAQFNAYAESTGMPESMRDGMLDNILSGIKESDRDKLAGIQAKFRGLNIHLTPDNLRYHYKKFQVTEEKRAELLAPTTYTLTDEEERDLQSMTAVVEALRGLRHHNNYMAYLRSFVADRMEPEKDRPISELARALHEHRCYSRDEYLRIQEARAEAERRHYEEWKAEEEAQEEKELADIRKRERAGIVEPTNADRSYIAHILKIRAHHKASKQRFGSDPEAGTEGR